MKRMNDNTQQRSLRCLIEIRMLILLVLFSSGLFAQDTGSRQGKGSIINVDAGIKKTTAEIMATPSPQRPSNFEKLRNNWEPEGPERENLPQAPGALDEPQWPASKGPAPHPGIPLSPQTLGIQFNGVTGPTETGAFPPDVMGAVGPAQFFVFVNGRMRTFDKTTGSADGVINVDPDVFFASVMTPAGTNQVTFTSDPNVRFDRLSGRWFLSIIDVTLSTTTGAVVVRRNRTLIAVSDGSAITGGTIWTFYFYQDPTNFVDYPSLGIDASALYIGGNMFNPNSFVGMNGYVIPKAPLLTGSPATVYLFNLLTGSSGPFAPRGVDNYNPNNAGAGAIGYFIGVDVSLFNLLQLRRVTNPGAVSGSPTISANISFSTTVSTQFPVKVPHLGNTGGNNGRLDALDDRLYAAHLRNGRLWTAHNIGVNNTGTTTGIRTRNASRWYEIQNLNGTPSVVQAGTLFDNTTPNNVNQRNYWIPTIMVSGQGHAALGCSIAGTNERINAFTTGRLAGDPLGTLREGPGGSTLAGYTSSSTAYNPPGDPGGSGGRRWGDYSFTSLDPNDDMTMWTIQEYCNGTNTYGAQAVKLIAPVPASPASANPPNVPAEQPSVNVAITGTSVSGQGFYDPGPDVSGGTPFNHISATVSGGVAVNSVTYTDPTHVTLNISTAGSTPGGKDVTITNPDGQWQTGTAILTIIPALLANAGSDITICPGASTTIGGSPTASGGTAPYTYSWSPTDGLDDASSANPTATPAATTTYTVTVTDDGGFSATDDVTVTVEDNEAPVITVISEPIVLWPPNHKYQTISLAECVTAVSDNCASLTVSDVIIVMVTSDEPEDAQGNGDGKTLNDMVIADDCQSVDIRKEREGNGNGRVYTIHFAVDDGNGNIGTATCQVHVPHNQGGVAIDDGPVYTVNGVCASSSFVKSGSGGDSGENPALLAIPDNFVLDQNYPNPFNPTTSIRFALSEAANVTLHIYDISGQLVRTLVSGSMDAGYYNIQWDATNDTGAKVASGIYISRISAGSFVQTRKMILMK